MLEKIRKASHIFSTKNIGIFEILTFEILTSRLLTTLLVLNNSALFVNSDILTLLQLSMRTIQTMEVLNLDHILGLSEKTLISLFSDVESNEMKRTYIYTCYLMPKQCQKQCTSFGSEMRAYAEIKKHLYQHLDELKKEALCKKLFFSCLDDT